jgi:hypothetical protein
MNQPLDNYRTPEAARLDALERRWTDVNQNQGRSITRLLVQRQRVLDLIWDEKCDITETTRDAIASALNSEAPPKMIAAIKEVFDRNQREGKG